jgi:hypothetical protein
MIPIIYSSNLKSARNMLKNKYFHWVEVHVYEPSYKNYPKYCSKSFLYWKIYIDALFPYRVSSVIKNKNNNRNVLKYIFDDNYSACKIYRKLLNLHPDLKILIKRYQHYY